MATSTLLAIDSADIIFMLGLIAVPLWLITFGLIFNAVSFR